MYSHPWFNRRLANKTGFNLVVVGVPPGGYKLQ
jgi:hypothetical protein